jgi:hypothetical protein
MKHRCLTLITAAIIAVPGAAAAQHDHGEATTPAAKARNEKKSPSALKPAEGASIKILKPVKGQTYKGDKVELHYKLSKGKSGHHAHAYVDGELMGMFESEKGTLNGIKPGKHVLELRVVAHDHTTELNAKDRVEFVVK